MNTDLPILWPVTVEGVLHPAQGKINQYEFYIKKTIIATKLPLTPYKPTASTIKGLRNKGIQVICKFRSFNSVECQFHRSSKVGVWIGSDFTNRGHVARQEWITFVSHF